MERKFEELEDINDFLIHLVDKAYPAKTHDNASARLVVAILVKKLVDRRVAEMASGRADSTLNVFFENFSQES